MMLCVEYFSVRFLLQNIFSGKFWSCFKFFITDVWKYLKSMHLHYFKVNVQTRFLRFFLQISCLDLDCFDRYWVRNSDYPPWFESSAAKYRRTRQSSCERPCKIFARAISVLEPTVPELSIKIYRELWIILEKLLYFCNLIDAGQLFDFWDLTNVLVAIFLT